MASLLKGKRDYDKVLIVEGGEDKYLVIQLMKSYVDWPDSRDFWPVYMDDGKGVRGILKRSNLTTELKSSTTKILGLILDADENPIARYQSIRNAVLEIFPDMPSNIPDEGLIQTSEDNPKFGLWIMPRNTVRGALEDFLEPMIPREQGQLWNMAEECVNQARNLTATIRDTHILKARLYTWLAWQDPPGYSPGNALARKVLDPHSSSCSLFVDWFRQLFELAPKA